MYNYVSNVKNIVFVEINIKEIDDFGRKKLHSLIFVIIILKTPLFNICYNYLNLNILCILVNDSLEYLGGN